MSDVALRLIKRVAREVTLLALEGSGLGRGWWGPSRGGTHKGHDPAYQVGITSHRPERAFQPQDLDEFRSEMGKTPAQNLSVNLGRGAWQGGWEPTFVTQYKGNGEAIKALARFGKKYNQDGVLIQKRVKRDDPDAQPQVQFEFDGRLSKRKIESIEKRIGQIKTGDKDIGGWTWTKQGGKHILILSCVPQFGNDAIAHGINCKKLKQGLIQVGTRLKSSTRYIKPTVMDQSNYDDFISGALTAALRG